MGIEYSLFVIQQNPNSITVIFEIDLTSAKPALHPVTNAYVILKVAVNLKEDLTPPVQKYIIHQVN